MVAEFVLIIMVTAACWVAMTVGALAVRTATKQGFVLFGPACIGCGYSLAGLREREPRCPECGVVQTVGELKRRARVRLIEMRTWRRMLWWCLASHLPGIVGCVVAGDSLNVYAAVAVVMVVCNSAVAATAVALVAARRAPRLMWAAVLVLIVGTFGLDVVLVLMKATSAASLASGVVAGSLWFAVLGSDVIAGGVFLMWCCAAAAVLAVKGLPGEGA